jgi:hypothetical protein
LGYHQIPLTEEDQPATMFITPFSCFCYVKLPFRLKNTRGTYLWCMQSCFKGQIGHNLEVYFNDIFVKSRKSSNLIADLEKIFNNLRRFNIKLNPENCTFVVPWRKLLGYIITERNIKDKPQQNFGHH